LTRHVKSGSKQIAHHWVRDIIAGIEYGCLRHFVLWVDPSLTNTSLAATILRYVEQRKQLRLQKIVPQKLSYGWIYACNNVFVDGCWQGLHVAIKRINRTFTPSKPLLLECKKVGRCSQLGQQTNLLCYCALFFVHNAKQGS